MLRYQKENPSKSLKPKMMVVFKSLRFLFILLVGETYAQVTSETNCAPFSITEATVGISGSYSGSVSSQHSEPSYREFGDLGGPKIGAPIQSYVDGDAVADGISTALANVNVYGSTPSGATGSLSSIIEVSNGISANGDAESIDLAGWEGYAGVEWRASSYSRTEGIPTEPSSDYKVYGAVYLAVVDQLVTQNGPAYIPYLPARGIASVAGGGRGGELRVDDVTQGLVINGDIPVAFLGGANGAIAIFDLGRCDSSYVAEASGFADFFGSTFPQQAFVAGKTVASSAWIWSRLELDGIDNSDIGDTNLDGVLNATDIDTLAATARAGGAVATLRMDLNFDQRNTITVSSGTQVASDSDYLVKVVIRSQYGDANLDGRVSVGDLAILSANINKPGTFGWAQGDFNGDNRVSVSDLAILSSNINWSRPAPVVSTVPEPYTSSIVCVIVVVAICFVRCYPAIRPLTADPARA